MDLLREVNDPSTYIIVILDLFCWVSTTPCNPFNLLSILKA